MFGILLVIWYMSCLIWAKVEDVEFPAQIFDFLELTLGVKELPLLILLVYIIIN